MKKENRVEAWLTKALELEKMGHDHYLDLAKTKKTKDPAVADLFKTLAEIELTHIEYIKHIYGQLDNELCWSGPPPPKGSVSSLKDLFKKITKQESQSPPDDLIKAIEVAIKFEIEAGSFYEQQIAEAECQAEHTFLTLMVGEENEHRLVLLDMKLFYTDPTSWMEQQENIQLDGA